MPRLEQETQLRNSRVYDDTLSPGAGLETPAGISLQEDLNALRSLLKRHLAGVAVANWYDDLLDDFGLNQIHDKPFVNRLPITEGTNDFTLGAPAQGTLVNAGQLVSGSGTIAVGPSSTENGGLQAADEANFTVAGTLGVGLSTALDGNQNLLNKVDIIVDSTNDPPLNGSGVLIFGLLQVITGTGDGAAVAGGGSENLQISFVSIDPATGALQAETLPADDYHFGLPILNNFFSLDRGSLISGQTGIPDIISPGAVLLRQPFREFDITGPGPGNQGPSANDPFNVQTGTFTGGGAQTVFATFGTPVVPPTGAQFRDDERIKVWRNGNLQSKGASAADNRDVYFVSSTQLAFETNLRIGEIITIESLEAF